MTRIKIIDEKELLLKLRDGDHWAFEQLYRKFSSTLYANILRMVHDEKAADDLLQELFIKIWEKRAEIDPDKSFKGYLFTCSRFLVLNFLRHISVETQVENYLSRTRSEIYNHVEEEIYLKETDTWLTQVIAKLPPQRQKIYSLCKIEGLSYEEVAAQLGISISTVQDHIVKANRLIKQELQTARGAVLLGLLLSHMWAY